MGAAVDKRVGGKTIKNIDDWADVKHAIDYDGSAVQHGPQTGAIFRRGARLPDS